MLETIVVVLLAGSAIGLLLWWMEAAPKTFWTFFGLIAVIIVIAVVRLS